MKSKIFKIALTIIIMLIGMGKGIAQQTSSFNSSSSGSGWTSANDTSYHTKMNELNAKMRDLQKQMTALAKKQSEEMRAKQRELLQKVDQKIKTQTDANNYNHSYYSGKDYAEGIKNGTVKQVTKNYSKTYTMDRNDALNIDNQFGDVVINTWNKNEVKVDVTIQGISDQQDMAQKIMDGISISDSKDGDDISFRTNFARTNSNESHSYKINSMVVNYTVYMPAKNALSIKNQFGKTDIPDFEGKLTIIDKFGSFTGKNLTNTANSINNQFMSTKIATLKGGDLKVAHGSLDLGSADNLNLNVEFSPVKIGVYRGSGTISLNFANGFNIADLDKNVKALTINSNFSTLTFGINKDANFNFEVNVQHGSFNYGDNNVNITSKTPSDNERSYSFSKSYKGNVGKGSTDKVITIKSNMGSVNFN